MQIALHRRSGFTLLELLVVIGIIVLLVGITVGAVFRLRESQEEKNSTEAVRQIQIGFDQKWKAVGDNIRNQKPVPQVIVEATRKADGSFDPVRANALHMKLRLRQEFPQTFAEADRALFQTAYPNVPQPYLPKPLFSMAVSGKPGASADEEAAVLLYLILSQGQGGITFDPETVGGVQSKEIPERSGVFYKVFADAWGKPISFRRWADANDNQDIVAELSQPPLAPARYPDVQDPEGRLGPLQANNWFQASPRSTALGLFISNRPNRPVFNQTINPFDGMNRGPYVFSAGKDGVYGSADDLYGFRLQQSGRGN